ncbi:hypothetical protein [Methylobacterium ajmalii]|uniref:hypothetical protein n=1 Tax=Methylobacterium ajmalii TaxID=2738439 RepID=UPI002F34F616
MRGRLDPGAGSLSDYYDWFKAAGAGAQLVYHNGDLASDRQVPVLDAKGTWLEGLPALADRIRKDAEDGYLILTQHRLGDGITSYIATRVRSSTEDTHTMVRHRHAAFVPA